ncbi:hypothetical protein AQUCO_00900627v1 [Aquilegia coerulea]|uniref:VQ domain-containing protein n=1 Tax=Aquilegia coerulea TaxID=218851 RepID=A0A2G5EEQ5_AQUCA|nr:hypothetical protein AQUCO_00900627v1 [Aquilegia coerulea]
MYMFSSDENLKRVSVSPRGELQGPRPPALKIGKDSYRIKKPQSATRAITTRRPPVVIHLKSPEIIHTRPQDFRGIVQKLTGKPKSLARPTAISAPQPKFDALYNMMVQDYRRYEIKDLNDFNSNHDENLQVKEVLTLNASHGISSLMVQSTISPAAGLLLPSPNVYNNWLDSFGPVY